MALSTIFSFLIVSAVYQTISTFVRTYRTPTNEYTEHLVQMSTRKIESEKTRLHPRNRNRKRYDLEALVTSCPELKPYIATNKYGTDSIDFSNPIAVKLLNRALLAHYYGITFWDFPDTNLCPPIPGRADYIHHMADILADANLAKIPRGHSIKCLDIGVGASCIYPIIGVAEYGWSFIGSDIDEESLEIANHNIDSNALLKKKVELRLQKDPHHIYQDILAPAEKIDLTICNPPFYSSTKNAAQENRRKVKNLSRGKKRKSRRNFSGKDNELISQGGASVFIRKMIEESRNFADNCFWFSSLVAKQAHLKGIHSALKRAAATQVKTIPMGTGNKSTRIVAWTFLSQAKQKEWRETRWGSENEEE